jgi:hypothetical protein
VKGKEGEKERAEVCRRTGVWLRQWVGGGGWQAGEAARYTGSTDVERERGSISCRVGQSDDFWRRSRRESTGQQKPLIIGNNTPNQPVCLRLCLWLTTLPCYWTLADRGQQHVTFI